MQDELEPGPDGGVTDGNTAADAKVPPPDGIPPNLTPCEQAEYHSDFAWIQRAIFDVSCTSGCHRPGTPLNLTAGASHANLVDVVSRTDSDWLRVAPGEPGASMLLVQLGGEPGPPLEGFMPWGQPRLCDQKIDAIRRWIRNGARND